MTNEERLRSSGTDEIHHPDHYTWKGTECKKVIEIMTQGLSGAEAYYMGNIIKYLYRYKDKDGAEDLQKAVVYLEKLREENLPKDDDAPPEVRDE